jgi:DNA-binding MurR/RpiR family transcriptional regulator
MIPPKVELLIRQKFSSLSSGMKKVGRYVRDHPEDVALLSMREQSRRAGVSAASMTRFAQKIGFSGYDEMRDLFAASVRGRVSDFGLRAGNLATRREEMGESSLAAAVADALVEGVSLLATKSRLADIVRAGAALSSARRIFCVGHRSCYAPAYHFAYTARLNGVDAVLLDGPGGIGFDPLANARPEDAILAVSIAPYTRGTVRIAVSASELKVPIVALSDSAVSPLARIASHAITIPADLANAAYSTAPIFATVEILAALVVANSGQEGRERLERNEAELARRNIYWDEAPEGAMA